MIRLQNLQDNQYFIARVLYVVTIRPREIRYIARPVIKRRSLARRRE